MLDDTKWRLCPLLQCLYFGDCAHFFNVSTFVPLRVTLLDVASGWPFSMFRLKALACALLLVGPASVSSISSLWTRDLDSFVAAERARAVQGILDNIGASGELAQGAEPGIVVASPSKANPNCTTHHCSSLGILLIAGC